MTIGLRVAVKGDLDKALKAELWAGEIAVTNAVRGATDGLKAELRGQVRGAGLGNRLANSWRGQTFPRSGRSLGAAGLVFSKAPKLHRAFNEGVTIRSKDGFFLAIPTPAAPRRGVGGKRISPSNFPEHRFGRLRFVYRRGRPSLLVVDGLRASFSRATGELRGFRRATVRKRTQSVSLSGITTVIMFILVPQVRLRKRLDVDRAARRWQGALPGLILRNWPELRAA